MMRPLHINSQTDGSAVILKFGREGSGVYGSYDRFLQKVVKIDVTECCPANSATVNVFI